MRAAAPLTLHDDHCWRTDGNSPVIADGSGVLAFFSHYLPRGHTLRRAGARDLHFQEASVPVILLDEVPSRVGTWIEAIWREPGGRLRCWFHAEEPASRDGKLSVPHIGEMISADNGKSWRGRRTILAFTDVDCSWRNGFFAGGCGDLCVVPDPSAQWLYLFFTSYHVEPQAQGIAVMRLPAGQGEPELWCGEGWVSDLKRPPRPIWPVERGWRHQNPESFWGPAVHFNRSIGRYVMLLNRTANGEGDLRQEGIYVSCCPTLADPTAWSRPMKLVEGGAWYPQVIGLQAGDGDTRAGGVARFFMAGFSLWELEFTAPGVAPENRPLRPTEQEFFARFGRKRCPW